MRRSNLPLSLAALLLALAALAQAGCDSRASFPYDQSLCGNERLDDNEPCDFDKTHNQFLFNGPLCHNAEGFVGGTPACRDCQIVHEGYCIPYSDCNAFQSSGCDNEKYCYFFPESKATGCAAPGGHAPGDRCDDSSQCQPMSLCVDQPGLGKICSLICDRNDPHCPGNTPCQTNNDFPTPLGYCEHLALECDPITNNRCLSSACYFFQHLEPQVQCAPTADSPSREGQDCGSSDQCLPTLTCIEGDCRQLCNIGTPCAPGHTCSEGLGFLDYGVCPEGKSCDPVTGSGCRGWLDCNFADTGTVDRFCGPTGQAPKHSFCEFHGDCQPGLFCTGLQDENQSRNCHPLCNAENQCMGGDVCALYSDEFLPGVCVIPRSCNVLENTGCDPPFECTIVNDHGDLACLLPDNAHKGDPCSLLWSCAPGLFCDNQGNGNRVCREICDVNSTMICNDGTACTHMPWTTTLPQVGVCK